MAVRAVSEQFKIARQNTAEATRRLLIKTAKEANARVMTLPPIPAGFIRIVDGREGAAEETVKPFGVIVYLYRRVDVVAVYALAVLRELSPVGSGRDPHPSRYRDSHMLFLNGVAVAPTALAGAAPGSDIAISNPVPYARKIEVGGMKMTVPGTDHVYQRAEEIVRRRYGQVAKIRFTYRTLNIAGAEGRQPALQIIPR